MTFNIENINTTGDYFLQNKKTIAVAESVTAGNIQAALSLAKNASMFFQGGITTYNLGHKCRHLNIDPIHALQCNCVSEIIADQMARKVCELFLADYGIGITGFASLVPEENINELFAFISIALNGKIVSSQRIEAKGQMPNDVQIYYANEAIRMLNNVLL